MKKHYFLAALLCVFVMFIAVCKFILPGVNYGKNLNAVQVEAGDLILNQHEYKLNKYGMGNIAKNGCGVVALYNILTIDGYNVDFNKLCYEADLHGSLIFGLLGTKPDYLKSFLMDYNYSVEICDRVSLFDEKAKNCRFAILCYWSFHGGHYQLMCNYNKNDQTYQLINPTLRCTMKSLIDETQNYTKRFLFCIN